MAEEIKKATGNFRLLFVGDVCGRPGREMLELELAKVQWDKDIDFTIINGENATSGKGLNRKSYEFFMDLGIDAITMGNHTWDNKDLLTYIDKVGNIARPLNYPKSSPGVGYVVLPIGKTDLKIAVVNLIGRTYMNNVVADCPFVAIENILPELREITPIIFVDFHGETTSEKIAFSRFVDGKVSAVIGTHTHVQTNDYRLLPQGTAYITDAGMTGPLDSALGMEVEPIIQKFMTGMPRKFQVAEGDLLFNGVVVEMKPTGEATHIEVINFNRQA